MRALRSTPLVTASMLALFGCANAPDGPLIVLQKRSPAPHASKPAGPVKTTAASTQDEVPLSASEKAALFRAFETYLDQKGPHK